MNAFLAVLKDSYKEARDGYVVIAMVGILAILMVVTLSMSFEAATPEEALPQIVQRFSLVFPERGASRIPASAQGAKYSVSAITQPTPETLSFTLSASSLTLFGGQDGLRVSVVNWKRPAGMARSLSNLGFGPPIEVAQMDEVSKDEAAAVSDAEIAEFLEHCFHVHAGFDTVVIERTSPVAAEPKYTFQVTVTTGSNVRGWAHTTKLFFGSVTVADKTPLGIVIWIIEEQIINGFAATLLLLIGIVITGFFIPNMLRKGSLDLLITKPIRRWQLLLYKYIGGLTFVGLLSAIGIGGMWLVIGLRSGYWDAQFLLLIPILTFTFAILYAVSTLSAVLTRSGVVAILVTVFFAFFLYVMGVVKTLVDERMADPVKARETSKWIPMTVNTVHAVLPRYKDLDRLTTKLITDGTLTPVESFMLAKGSTDFPDWRSTVAVSLVFIALVLALANWRFSTRDG
jgi:ABC-type transport system involved in multi-copper enzyme maturation permease subunit